MHGRRTASAAAARRAALARGLATAAAVAGLGCAGGCGSVAPPVALPGRHALPKVAAAPQRSSQRQLVLAAYEGYWRATSQALDSRSATRAARILAGYIPRSAVPALVGGLRRLWQQDEVSYGSPVFHIMSVRLTGNGAAAVHDCIDLSHTGFANRQTGQIIGGLGQSHDYLITTLALRGGRWLVTGAIPVVRSCAW